MPTEKELMCAIDVLLVQKQGHFPSDLYEDGYSDACTHVKAAIQLLFKEKPPASTIERGALALHRRTSFIPWDKVTESAREEYRKDAIEIIVQSGVISWFKSRIRLMMKRIKDLETRICVLERKE